MNIASYSYMHSHHRTSSHPLISSSSLPQSKRYGAKRRFGFVDIYKEDMPPEVRSCLHSCMWMGVDVLERRGGEEGGQVHANRSDAWFACIDHSTKCNTKRPPSLFTHTTWNEQHVRKIIRDHGDMSSKKFRYAFPSLSSDCTHGYG